MLKRVYVAADPVDAGFVRGLLESSGVSTLIKGDMLWGGRGELPVTDDTAPTLWVSSNDYARARALIEEIKRPVEHPQWKCPGCGEVNDGAFHQCWQCGTVCA